MTTRPCGCPSAGVVAVDDEAHGRWHQLVVAQGGPAGVVDVITLPAARVELAAGSAVERPDRDTRWANYRRLRRTGLVLD
jgi:hypothetical protein